MRKSLLIAAMLLATCNALSATETAYLKGATYIGDTWIDIDNPTTNYSADSVMTYGKKDSETAYKCVFEIKPLGLPWDAVIDSAKFWVTVDTYPSQWCIQCKKGKILQSVTTEETTWNIYASGSSWDSAGCNRSNVDYEYAQNWGLYCFGTSPVAGDSVDLSQVVGAGWTAHLNANKDDTWYWIIHYPSTHTLGAASDVIKFRTTEAVEINRPRLQLWYRTTDSSRFKLWWWETK